MLRLLFLLALQQTGRVDLHIMSIGIIEKRKHFL
jgi:hypothetical protein